MYAYNHFVNETMKNVARHVLGSDMPMEKRVEAGELLIGAYYERALVCGEGRSVKSLSNMSFEEYASMVLQSCKRNHWENYMDVYNILVEKYGLSDGLELGKTYVFTGKK